MLPAITTRKSGYDVERRKQRNLYLSGWRTGSAAWLFMTGVECLLGARAEYDGLAVEPRLPSEWNKARLVRAFRGATYDIRIRRDRCARQSIKVDGHPLDGNLVPVFGDGKTHIVEVQVP